MLTGVPPSLNFMPSLSSALLVRAGFPRLLRLLDHRQEIRVHFPQKLLHFFLSLFVSRSPLAHSLPSLPPSLLPACRPGSPTFPFPRLHVLLHPHLPLEEGPHGGFLARLALAQPPTQLQKRHRAPLIPYGHQPSPSCLISSCPRH